MLQKKVTVLARIKAKKGMEEKVKRELASLIAPTHQEASCIDYVLHQATDDKAMFMFYENWTSKKALDEHLAMPYLKAFVAKAGELLAEPLDVTLWEMVGG
jgi:quinol monooxygenase YgiN